MIVVQWLCRALLLLLVIFIAITLPRLSFDNNILALFPEARDFAGQSQADALRSRQLERRVLLLIGADDPDAARNLVTETASRLQQSDFFNEVSTQAENTLDADLSAFYRARAPLLLTDSWRQRLAQDEANAVADAALRRLLTEPGGGLAERLQYDPLGNVQAFRQQSATRIDVRLDTAGFAYVQDQGRDYYLLSATLADSPYRLDIQSGAGALIDHINAQVRALPGGELLHTGVLFFTRAGTEQARGEISTVGVGSLMGIVLLLLLVFRSPLLLLLAFLPIAVGVLTGLCVTWWLFGSVHVMALMFGAALVGVAIDYSLHFFTKRLLAGRHWCARTGIRRLLPPLLMGLITSSAAYLSFTSAGFPGFSQIAVFSASGLIAAFMVVVGTYPLLLAGPGRRGLSARFDYFLQQGVRWHQRRVRMLLHPMALVVLALILIAALFNWRSNDDIRQMQLPDPALAAMEKRVAASLGATMALPYILVSAPDAELLLQRLEQLHPGLDAAVAEGHLAAYQSLAQWLPSVKRQRNNAELWQRQLLNSGVLLQLVEQLGMAPESAAHLFEPNVDAPLRPNELWPLIEQRPDAPGYFVEQDSHYALVGLSGLAASEAVAALADSEEFAVWVDPVARTSALLGDYRRTA
ncbi:MAG TPA: MMPL family transporter, partial [Marinobacter sp.]|nr:MMPL family transporter [Marinobacter sp.]